MLCDICHKRKAVVHITEIINDQVKELHICQECADEKAAEMQQSFGIADLLHGLVDIPDIVKKKEKAIKCPECGMTYADFKKLGRLGCASCYDAFQNMLAPLIKKIHGSTMHIGREPAKVLPRPKEGIKKRARPLLSKQARIRELKAELQEAIKAEEYETAAVLRDRIRALEKEWVL